MSQASLATLPREIRDMVYDAALSSGNGRRSNTNECAVAYRPPTVMPSPEYWSLLSIQASTLHIATEARAVYFGSNTFEFNHIHQFESFLSGTSLTSGGPTIFDVKHLIQKLRFDLLPDYLVDAHQDLSSLAGLLKECPRLKEVSIVLDLGKMERYHQCEAVLALRDLAKSLHVLNGLVKIDCQIQLLCMLVNPCDKEREAANIYVDWSGSAPADPAEGLLKGVKFGLPSLVGGCKCGKIPRVRGLKLAVEKRSRPEKAIKC